MSEDVTENTKALLLLTSPLMSGKDPGSAPILSLGDYRKLHRVLDAEGASPSDLTSPQSDLLLAVCDQVLDRNRLELLLSRGFQLGPAIDAWQARSIWVLGKFDPDYPHVLTTKLGDDAPPVLFGCGDKELLDSGGLAIVGSRDADITAKEFTEQVATQAAHSQVTVVSGGARGVDQWAMAGALNEGGRVIGVVADSLARLVVDRQNREVLMEGQLTLVSPYDPHAGFNVGNAMGRNKLIYASADAGLIVSSDLNKGGTWAGAKEQLDRYSFGPLYVRPAVDDSPGLQALVAKGAAVWPSASNTDEFRELLQPAGVVALPVRDSSLTLF